MIVGLREFVAGGRYAGFLADELIDMELISPAFARILCRKCDLGREPIGVTRQFLQDAETYHRKYFKPAYFKHLIAQALARLEYGQRQPAVLDLGAGSGNSVIAALELLEPRLLVAVDISPQLLAILRDYLDKLAGGSSDCALVCMDACENPYRHDSFDLALGAAFLHHMPDPQRALAAIHAALRPGGHAIFFEPFENGNAILALAFQEILDCTGRRRQLDGHVTRLLTGTIRHLETVRWASPEERNRLDDKWVFTRGSLEELQQAVGFQRLTIYPIHPTEAPFSRQAETLLRVGLEAPPEALPPWAWTVLNRYDSAFSDHLKRDLLIEGAIIMTK